MIEFKEYPLDDEWNTYAKVGVEYGVLTAYISCIGHGTSFYGKILIGDRSDVRETVNNAVAIALSQLNTELIKNHWLFQDCDDKPEMVETYSMPSRKVGTKHDKSRAHCQPL